MSLSTSVYLESAAAAEVCAAVVRVEQQSGVLVIGESSWAQESDTTSVPPPFGAAFRLTQQDREDLVRSLVNSQAIEGIEVPLDEAERILDQVLREPLPDIG